MRKTLNTYIKITGAVVFAFAIFGYGFFQAKNVILGPIIKINHPQNGASVETSLVEIEGLAKNISRISMDGNQIFTDERGIFKEKLLLSYGYNIITIEARDRFGRETVKMLELVYK